MCVSLRVKTVQKDFPVLLISQLPKVMKNNLGSNVSFFACNIYKIIVVIFIHVDSSSCTVIIFTLK